MNSWVVEWMDGWKDGWLGEWLNGWMGEWIDDSDSLHSCDSDLSCHLTSNKRPDRRFISKP